MYYLTKSATLFMAIITFPKSWILGRETDIGTMYETHAFWSDDKLQDVYFVDVAYKKLLQNLRSRYVHTYMCTLSRAWYSALCFIFLSPFRFPAANDGNLKWYQWSDNCCNQFKCAQCLYLRTKYSELQVDVEQHMGAPGHGEGTWDGEGGILKSYAAKELRRENGVHLNCAQVFRSPCYVFSV